MSLSSCDNIILAIDGSENSNAALKLLSDLDLELQSCITVLSVLDTPHTPRRQLLLAALEHSKKQLSSAGYKVKTGILHGHPAQTILEYAEEHKPDLIVFGARGRRATFGILLGGVAQQMVEYSKFPVLVVRSSYERLNKILILTDGSDYSMQALKFILNLPIRKDADFRVIHVSPPTASHDLEIIAQTWPMGAEVVHPIGAELPEEINRSLEEEKQRGENLLNEATNLLQKRGIQAKKTLLKGDAATEILEYAEANEIDLIIAGSRGLSQVQGWLLGSVSRKLVHYAKCSVLIVK